MMRSLSSQQNIPVPPRPSSQSESGQNRMSHSPVAPQGGYNQPMAPPHLTPSMYGNKGHPGMMGGSQQMASYSPQNQAYSQGSYPRNHQGSMGMQGYGNQSQTYPGSQPNSMSQQLYGMNRIGNHMPAAQGYGGGGNSTSVEPVAIQDEASQQSTASNTSNTDEQAETLRPRKDVIVQSHPPTPASTLPSPGAVSMSSFHDEFENASSPSWPRTPASPRPDSLNKLYDISDDPERRSFLDRLMQFNDERGSALTQCPTISKQPLDLFKLYLVLKDRGGFVEVTKSKQWKDVAGQIGIGASSSAAYTLRKQYVKHLLPYECKFDRGGIDPQPIISQLEVATRKKNSSKTNTAPSPAGSSNSQDSFTASNSQSMDGFPTPPAPPPFSQYSQSGSVPNSDYPVGSIMGPIPPSSMPNSDPSPHPNMMHPPPHNSDSINVQNPFADDMQAHPYPRGSNMNSAMPPPSLQNYGYGSGGSMQQRAAPNIPPVSIPPAYAGNQPMPGQNPPAPTYSYNEQINRGMPMAPQSDQFPPTDQYRRGQQQMMNHDGAYNNRMPESYGAAGPNYSPARMPGTALQFPCGPQFDRESGQAMPAREPVYPPRSYSGSPAAQHGAPADQYRQEQSYPLLFTHFLLTSLFVVVPCSLFQPVSYPFSAAPKSRK
uniref:ARID domain-containing protein n=1 Tax=Strigamia maritima TaxID=126957 RepID=T1IQ74_STRMM